MSSASSSPSSSSFSLLSPHVLVFSSPQCAQIFSKNHLTPAEFLKPFGFALSTNPTLGSLYFRTPTRGGYQLNKSFSLNFICPQECVAMPNPLAEEYLNCILHSNPPAPNRVNDSIKEPRDIQPFYRSLGSESSVTPWFNQYRTQFYQSLRFQPQESIDQPVHLLFLVAGSEASPCETVEAMRAIDNFPPLFKSGYFDWNLPRSIVVLHDKHWDLTDSQALDKTLQTVKQLKAIYSSEVLTKILEINSLAAPNLKQNDIWSPHIPRSRVMTRFASDDALSVSIDSSTSTVPTPFQVKHLPFSLYESLFTYPSTEMRGQFISSQDMELTNSIMGELLTKAILPPIERKISQLTEKVTALRKGFKNAMKSLFGRKDKPTSNLQRTPSVNSASGSSSLPAPLYPLDSPEAQTRQLADLAFLFQDYELAAAHYRMCVSDAKNEKAYLHVSLAQEMLGLSVGLAEGSQYREMKECLESACNSYIQIGAFRSAVRAALSAVEMYKMHSYSNSRQGDTLNALLRVVEREIETSRTPLLLEQLAYAFLSCANPPLVRKYAFHLVQAGHGYHRFGLIPHGIRCYTSAAFVYQGLGWNAMEQRLFLTLARDWAQMNNLKESMNYYGQLLTKERAPADPSAQSAILKEFLTVSQRLIAASPTPPPPFANLSLPAFIDSSIAAQTCDSFTIAASFTNSCWSANMRSNQRMTLDPDIMNKPLFDPQPSGFKDSDRNCVINERITISVTIENPLDIELALQRIQLKCRHSRPESESDGATHDPSSGFVCESLDFTLQPRESRTIDLYVTPISTGNLLIEGAQWTIGNSLHGFHPFSLPPRLVHSLGPGGRRKKPEITVDNSLYIPIIPEMPRLSLEFLPSPLPARIYQGEFLHRRLRLKNTGQIPLHKVSLRVSHPGYFLIGKPSGVGSSAVAASSGSSASPFTPQSSSIYPYHWQEALIHFNFSLQPGDSVELPLYLRAIHSGSHLFGFLFRYEPIFPSDAPKTDQTMKFRLGYCEFPVNIQDLLHVKLFQRPSFRALEENLLGIELERPGEGKANMLAASGVEVVDITAQSRIWRIVALMGSDGPNIPLNPLQPAESAYSFLRIWNSAMVAGTNANEPVSAAALADYAALPMASTSVRLLSSASSLALPADFPLADFFQLEKSLHLDADRQALIINPAARIADVGAADKFDFTLSWRVGDRMGAYHSVGVNIMKPQPTACPLKVFLDFPSTVEHDFPSSASSSSTLPILSVPIRVRIRNILDYSPVSFLFETLSPEEEFDPNRRAFRSIGIPQYSLLYSHKFLWKGVSRARITNLKPGKETELELNAEFFADGIYNLNRFRFTVEIEAAAVNTAGKSGNASSVIKFPRKPRVFFFPLQHLMEVKSKSAVQLQAREAQPTTVASAALINSPVDFLSGSMANISAPAASLLDFAPAPAAAAPAQAPVSAPAPRELGPAEEVDEFLASLTSSTDGSSLLSGGSKPFLGDLTSIGKLTESIDDLLNGLNDPAPAVAPTPAPAAAAASDPLDFLTAPAPAAASSSSPLDQFFQSSDSASSASSDSLWPGIN